MRGSRRGFSGRAPGSLVDLPHPFLGEGRQGSHPRHDCSMDISALPLRPHRGAGMADPAEDMVGEPDDQVEGLPRRRGQEPRQHP